MSHFGASREASRLYSFLSLVCGQRVSKEHKGDDMGLEKEYFLSIS